MLYFLEDDIKPLVRESHIPRYHYVYSMFDLAFLRCTERLAWLWGTSGGLSDHNKIGTCSGEDAKPTTVFNRVIGKMDTAVSIAFYNARFVEVRELGCTILPDFAGPTDPDIFQDVNLPFGVTNDA